MKALHVIQRYQPARLTGSEMAMVVVCEALAQQGEVEVLVATSDVDAGEGFYDPRINRFPQKTETINKVKVYRLPVQWWLSSVFYVLNKLLPWLNQRTGGKMSLLSFGPRLIGLDALIDRLTPELIHAAPIPMTHVVTAWQAARRASLPFVLTPTMHFDDPKFFGSTIDRILLDADQLIAHTEFEKKELVKRGVLADKITVIPSSFLTDQDFAAGKAEVMRKRFELANKPVALFLGSKSLDKGTIHLLKAWPKVRAAVPEAVLMVAGVSTQSWEEAKKGKSLEGIIELDYVSDEEKQDLLRGCDLLCIPSRTESFGMILLEAWAKAKPVIGGSAGATREMINDGEDGYTVEFGDVRTLADRLIELLQDSSKRQQMGKAGLAKAKGFTKERLVEKTLEVYRRAMASK